MWRMSIYRLAIPWLVYEFANFVKQNNIDYPLISRSKTIQNFRSKLTGFFDQLIEVMHECEALYQETVLLENIHQWIATLSSSTTRPFRHTATLVMLTMTTARCRIARAEIETAAKVQRQLENEAKSKRPNKARLADFQGRVDRHNEKKSIIEGQIRDCFDTVYVHRYRDVDPKIRTECAEALGTWISSLESYFSDGLYLRYLGWMLSDTYGPLRQSVVLQLQKIMKTVNHGGIRHFIDRFRQRLIEMAARDSEPAVRVHTIELLTLIRNAEMLKSDDKCGLGRLVFDTEPRVRKAIANFFISNVEELYETRIQEIYGDEVPDTLEKLSEKEDFYSPRPSWIKYKCLAEILVEYDTQDSIEIPSQGYGIKHLKIASNESRFTLAAQTIFEKMSQLKEWQILSGYLLFDHTSRIGVNESETDNLFLDAVKPTESEEVVLLEILNTVIKLSLRHFDEPAKGDKKRLSKTEILDAKETAARHLANLIIRLLKKYGADPLTAAIILRLVHVLDLGCFHEIRQGSSVCSDLLGEICKQFQSHADIDVLKEACVALLHIREYEESEEAATSKIHSSWEENINMLQKINRAGEISIRGGSLSEKLLTELTHILAKLEQLSCISNSVEFMDGDLSKEEPCPITLIFDIIARGELAEGNDNANDFLEDAAVQSAMRIGLFYFMWKIRSMSTSLSSGQNIPANEIELLRERQEIFIANLIASFSSRACLDEVRLLGAGTLLDLFVTFTSTLGDMVGNKVKTSQGGTNVESYRPVSSLVREIEPDVQQELTLLFCELERQFARKSKRKTTLPGDDEAPDDLESETEDDETNMANQRERFTETLAAEEQLCQYTGKLILAILAQVIDFSGPSKNKLRSRLLRNRNLLGPNFKEVVAFLEESKPKGKTTQKNKPLPGGNEKTKPSKNHEIVISDDEDEIARQRDEEEEADPFADEEHEKSHDEEMEKDIAKIDHSSSDESNGDDDKVMRD